MNYYISDIHIGHRSLAGYERQNALAKGRGYPFDSYEARDLAVTNALAATCSNKRDTLYILGDISLGSPVEAVRALLAQIPAKKVLVLGNHDKRRLRELEGDSVSRVTKVCDYLEMSDNGTKLVLCHYPILMWNGQHKGSVHLYGHVHNSVENDLAKELGRKSVEGRLPEFRAANVGACLQGFRPMTLEQIAERENFGIEPWKGYRRHE